MTWTLEAFGLRYHPQLQRSYALPRLLDNCFRACFLPGFRQVSQSCSYEHWLIYQDLPLSRWANRRCVDEFDRGS